MTATIKLSASTKTRRHPLSKEAAPLVRLPQAPTGQGGWEGEVVEVDGVAGYVWSDATGEMGVYRQMVCLDAGDNEIRRRTAPESLNGLTAGAPRGQSYTDVADGLIAWVDTAKDDKPRDGFYGTSEETYLVQGGKIYCVQSPDLTATGGKATVCDSLPSGARRLSDESCADLEISL